MASLDKNPLQMLRHSGTLADDVIGLADVALTLAACDSESGSASGTCDSYHAFLDRMCGDFGAHAGGLSSAMDRAEALAAHVGARYGFHGDRETYDDLANANLMKVIDRRKGLPVTLAILYVHVARSVGWTASGINFPGHVLVQLDGEGDRVTMDPFNDGAVVTAAGIRALLKSVAGPRAELKPEFYAASSDRALLVRLQNNVKLRQIRAGNFSEAIAVLERTLMFAPLEVDSWYELGALEIHRGDVRRGRNALETCLATLDMVAGRDDLRVRVLNTLNELASSMD